MGSTTLTQFLLNVRTRKDLLAGTLLSLVMPTTQPLFFAALVAYAKKQGTIPVIVRPMPEKLSELQNQLDITFLGQSNLFIFESGLEVEKLSIDFLNYLSSYQGPHQVILCTHPDQQLAERDGLEVVVCETTVSALLYQELYFLMCQQENSDTQFFGELSKRTVPLSLATACLFIQYQQVLGKSKQQFFTSWFDRIIEPKRSLFLLSQYFFSGDAASLYTLWSTLSQLYPPEFWIAYWSEQLWQAIIFIQLAKKEGPQAAKKHVNRLPFSFMQKDWQRHRVERFMKAHAELYAMDYALKHGARGDSFLLWFAHYFAQ